MKKRFATLSLALIMACSLAIPARAVMTNKVTVYGHPINDSFESFWMHVGKYYPVSSYVGNAIYKNFYERKYYYA